MSNIVEESKSETYQVNVDEMYPIIYQIERCFYSFLERYFRSDELPDDEAKLEERLLDYRCEYEYMAAMLRMIDGKIFDLRVMAELATGGCPSISKAHARIELGRMRMDKKLWQEIVSGIVEEQDANSSQAS